MLSVVNSNNRYAKMYQYLTLSFCHKINTAPLRPGAGAGCWLAAIIGTAWNIRILC